jgi:hypothetical protein
MENGFYFNDKKSDSSDLIVIIVSMIIESLQSSVCWNSAFVCITLINFLHV